MKKALPILLALSVILTSCAAIAAADAETRKEGAALAEAALSTGDIRIEVRDIVPSSSYLPATHSNGEYYIQIKNGKATAYLPFFGTSTSVNYGSSDGGIKFKDCPVDVTNLKARKSKGETKWQFSAVNDREKYDFTISFFDGGNANVYCYSQSRSPMNYIGQLEQVK